MDFEWTWGGLGVDLGWTLSGFDGLEVVFGFPLVVANEISSNEFLGSPIPSRPRDTLIWVVGGTTPRGCSCPQVSPDKGEEGVGLRFGHTTRTQERAQRLQVWKGRKKKKISGFRIVHKIFGFWRGRQILGFGGMCTGG